MTDSADMRHIVSARDGSHNTAAWLHPYKGWYCKYSIRNLRYEGEMRDPIHDADTLPAGLSVQGEKKKNFHSAVWGHIKVGIQSKLLSAVLCTINDN